MRKPGKKNIQWLYIPLLLIASTFFAGCSQTEPVAERTGNQTVLSENTLNLEQKELLDQISYSGIHLSSQQRYQLAVATLR